jgi:ubiquitin-protein ligase
MASAHDKTSTSTSTSTEVIHISKDSAMRILSDVREMIRFPLHDEGIYYLHDDEDILTGYAMLYGQPGTVYYGGYYFFKIKFPPDYPHKPPTVTFLSNDGTTRMHPNFYKNGYVCLSILGNWRGDQWSGCITLKSILLTMISIMDAKPMLHEPGVTPTHAEFTTYHRIIEYKNIEFTLCKLLDEREFVRYINIPDTCRQHYIKIMRELFTKHRDGIVSHVDEIVKRETACSSSIPTSLIMSVYAMNVKADYHRLKELVATILK